MSFSRFPISADLDLWVSLLASSTIFGAFLGPLRIMGIFLKNTFYAKIILPAFLMLNVAVSAIKGSCFSWNKYFHFDACE